MGRRIALFIFCAVAMSLESAAQPTMVFVEVSTGSLRAGAVTASAFPSSAGRVVSVSAAQDAQGNTFVAALDPTGQLWANVFSPSQQWLGWSPAAGRTWTGTPDIAMAPDGTPWIAVLDSPTGGYWLTSYTVAGGFGEFRFLGGDTFTNHKQPPRIAFAPGMVPSVYVASAGASLEDGVTTFSVCLYPVNSLQQGCYWRRAYRAFEARLFSPSIVVGSDGYAYVAAVALSGSVWFARLSGVFWESTPPWFTQPGNFQNFAPPQLTSGGGRIFVVDLDPNGGVWTNTYAGTGIGWQGWVYANGVLSDWAAAGTADGLFIAGRSSDNTAWWHSSMGGWSPRIGPVQATADYLSGVRTLSAAPR